MAVAPAAGAAIPEIPLAAIAFTALVAIVLMRGLLSSWQNTLGALFEYLGKELDVGFSVLGRGIHLDLGAPFRYADHYIVLTMQTALKESEHLLGWALHGMAVIAEWMAAELLSFSMSTVQALERLGHIHVPKVVTTTIDTVLHPGRIARIARAAVAGEILDLRKYTDRRLAELWKRIPGNLKKALPYVIPGAIAIPWIGKEVRSLEKWLHAHTKRIHRLEKLLGVTGMAIAIANVLGLPNWRCLTRGNLGRAARAICGMDKALIDLLVLGTIEGFIASDLCDFTKLLTAEAETLVPTLITLVDVEQALVGCSGVSPLAQFSLPPLSLPSVSGASLLAA